MDPAEWGTKRAVYERGSGSPTLTFVHEVVEPNISTQGIAVLADTLDANGGAIVSTATGAGRAARARQGSPTTQATRWTGGSRRRCLHRGRRR